MEKTYFVYILSNQKRTVLYTGVTSDLETKVYQHKTKENPKSFTAQYNCDALVYWEAFDNVGEAILREKQIKGWKCIKKDRIIMQLNPQWKDWSLGWYEGVLPPRQGGSSE